MRSQKVFLLVIALSFLGCGEKIGYQYYSPPPGEPIKYSSSKKVKDIAVSGDLDMLWVVDNSGSMQTYQNEVIRNLSNFIDALTNGTHLRWKIGMVSTSVGEQPYIGFAKGDELTYQDPLAATKFKAAIKRLGTGGDSTERTYQPVEDVLKAYPAFLRSSADLALILVSDAPEQSNITTADFLSFLSQTKGQLSKVTFYGVLDPSDWCPSTDDPFQWAGNKFEELVNKTNGAAYPICKPFDAPLIDIAQKVVTHSHTFKFPLEARPKPETLHVVYQGQDVQGGLKENGGHWVYSFSDNAIIFSDLDFAPGDQEEVQVVYEADQSSN